MANIWYIQVNRYCNNKCHFCSNPSNWEDISKTEWMKLIDDFIEKKYHWIIFTGWEPTLSKDLASWIQYAREKWINSRIISNGNRCANFEYFENLKKAWLELVHFSIYSHIEKIHDFLTGTPGSYKKVLQAIQNAYKLWIEVQINTVINKYNEEHLDKIVLFLNKEFPFINHFVWNNLDPLMMRQTKIALSTLPSFDKFSISLRKAMEILEKWRKTFRAERVPLCFMRWYEFASTETRKIVKNEERLVYFLDFREAVKQVWDSFIHDKLEECIDCDLNSICAWIYERDKFYNYVIVKPQKLTQEEKLNIINKIKNEESWY